MEPGWRAVNAMIPPLGEGGTQRRDRPYCVTLSCNRQVHSRQTPWSYRSKAQGTPILAQR
jgi:hypothetical protein